MFARREAKTRIRQRDWLTKQRIFSPTNHVAEFLFSLRVARTNSSSGKRTLDLRIKFDVRINQLPFSGYVFGLIVYAGKVVIFGGLVGGS